MDRIKILVLIFAWIYVQNIPSTDCRRRFRLRGGTATPPPTPSTTPLPPTTPAGVIAQRLGGNVKTSKYNNQLYEGLSGGPVSTADDLECNFDGVCCWDNVPYPTDQFDWLLASGLPDPKLFVDSFGVSTKPTGKYLVAARPKTTATNEAMFISCTITCTTRPVGVKFRHWTTQGVQLQVCSSETVFNDHNQIQLINCKDVKRTTSPGPTTVTIPPGDMIDIIFVATNFRSDQGGLAIIDDIKIDITPCSDTDSKPDQKKVQPEAHRQSK